MSVERIANALIVRPVCFRHSHSPKELQMNTLSCHNIFWTALLQVWHDHTKKPKVTLVCVLAVYGISSHICVR
jgi:hypothetical protein